MSKRLEISSEGNVTVARFKDYRLVEDMVVQGAIQELVDLVSSREHSFVVISFADVEFLSTSLLGQLVTVKTAAARANTKLKLCDLSDNLNSVFSIVSFDKVFDISSTVAKAVKEFRDEGDAAS